MGKNVPILPRGMGAKRSGFEQFAADLAEHYETQFEIAYTKEMENVLHDIIQHTPIATGAAAGVTHNLVASKHKELTQSHPAYGMEIGNEEGQSGWQLHVEQGRNTLKLSIINPMWDEYLKYLEFGQVPGADSHFVHDAWQRHLERRVEFRSEIEDA